MKPTEEQKRTLIEAAVKDYKSLAAKISKHNTADISEIIDEFDGFSVEDLGDGDCYFDCNYRSIGTTISCTDGRFHVSRAVDIYNENGVLLMHHLIKEEEIQTI